ncbi:MAG: Ig-like domain-containing protein [Spirochaetes bacterium]|nr:Ig-like domain-containing protein [Spirochaetota bacterium]
MKEYILRKKFPYCIVMIFFLALFLTGCDRFYNNALAELKEGKNELSLLAQLFMIHETIPPSLTSIIPDNQASGVARNSGISAIFSEDIDPATILESSFIITRDGQPVQGAFRCSRNSVTFRPSSNLDPNANYDIAIETGIKDLAGNNLERRFTWHFTTGTQVDTEPPVVTMTVPADQTILVPLNTAINIVLSESVDPVTVRPDTFIVSNNGIVVPGEIICKKNIIMFRPKMGLNSNGGCSVRITSGVSDMAGNFLTGNYTWSFYVSNHIDNTPPSVVQTEPLDGIKDISMMQGVSVFFNETIDPTTVTGASIYLIKDGHKIDCNVVYKYKMIELRDISPLENNTMYSVIVATNIKDLAGNMLKEPFTFSFSTLDNTFPEIPTFTIELSSDQRKINVKNIYANRARRFIIEWQPWDINNANWSSYDTGTIDTNFFLLYTTDILKPWMRYQVRVRSYNLFGNASSYSKAAQITTGSTFKFGKPTLGWTASSLSGTTYYSDLLLNVDLPDGAVSYSAHVNLNKAFLSNIAGGPPADVTQPIIYDVDSMLIKEKVKVYDSAFFWYWKLQQITGTVNIIFYNDCGDSYTTGYLYISAGTPPGLP